jgi:SAM-dependent methyltransferase
VSDAVHVHPDTYLELEALGTWDPPYRPTFDFRSRYIDRGHRALATAPVKDGLIQLRNRRWLGMIIPGWLRRDDALKLYELAYFASGDVLELGSHHGLSTSILARASRNAPRPKQVVSVDLQPTAVEATRATLDSLGLSRTVTVLCDDAVTAVRRFASGGRRFAFVFVDHAHAYEPVYQVCRELDRIMAPGGFCLFHDFNDVRNRDPHDHDYAVYQAVIAGLAGSAFRFCGIYGCTGLYRAVASSLP